METSVLKWAKAAEMMMLMMMMLLMTKIMLIIMTIMILMTTVAMVLFSIIFFLNLFVIVFSVSKTYKKENNRKFVTRFEWVHVFVGVHACLLRCTMFCYKEDSVCFCRFCLISTIITLWSFFSLRSCLLSVLFPFTFLLSTSTFPIQK